MYCPSCGKAIPGDSEFCPECGRGLPAGRTTNRPGALLWACLALLAAALAFGMVGFEAEGIQCGSPFSPDPFIEDDPCINAVWTRRVVIIVAGGAALAGVLYVLAAQRRRAS